MATTLTHSRIRVAADSVESKNRAVTDVLTNAAPAFWQASDLQVEVGVFHDGAWVDTWTNIASVTLAIKAPDALESGALAEVTVSTGDPEFNASATHSGWAAGTEQHVVFNLTKEETSIELAGAASRDLILYIWLTTNDATPKRIPLLRTAVTMLDSGWGDVGAIAITPPGARVRDNRLELLDPDTQRYYSVVIREVNGVPTLSIEGTGET